jgi:hypothetical protein
MEQFAIRICRQLAAPAVFGSVALAVLLVPLPDQSREVRAVLDLLHALVFFVFSVIVLKTVYRSNDRLKILPIIVIWVTITICGFFVEIVQPLVGRDMSWRDVWANSLGGGAGLLWASNRASTWRTRQLTVAISIALLLLAGWNPFSMLTDAVRQRLEFPLLASFESPLELSRWSSRECRVARVRNHVTDGKWSMRVELFAGMYPGVSFKHPAANWSAKRELAFDIYLENEHQLELTLKIEDAAHNKQYNDRFHKHLVLTPGAKRVVIPLKDVASAPAGRLLDLSHVTRLQIFAHKLSRPSVVYLDDIHLR